LAGLLVFAKDCAKLLGLKGLRRIAP
jgi:hypothetical protein